jgi:hypothetical protein
LHLLEEVVASGGEAVPPIGMIKHDFKIHVIYNSDVYHSNILRRDVQLAERPKIFPPNDNRSIYKTALKNVPPTV